MTGTWSIDPDRDSNIHRIKTADLIDCAHSSIQVSHAAVFYENIFRISSRISLEESIGRKSNYLDKKGPKTESKMRTSPRLSLDSID